MVLLGPCILWPYHLPMARPALPLGPLTSQAPRNPGFSQETLGSWGPPELTHFIPLTEPPFG